MIPEKMNNNHKRHCVNMLVAGKSVELIARYYAMSEPEMTKALQKWAVEAEKGNLG